jgi:hypothetical protein
VRLEQLQPERCRACPTCEWVDGFAVIVDLANGGAILDTQYLGNSSVLDIVLNYPGPFNSLRTLYDTIDIGNMGMTTLCGETTYFAYDRDGIVVGAASQFDPNLLTSLVSGAPGLVAYRNRQADFTFDTANFGPTNYVTQFRIEKVDLKSGEVMATKILDTEALWDLSGVDFPDHHLHHRDIDPPYPEQPVPSAPTTPTPVAIIAPPPVRPTTPAPFPTIPITYRPPTTQVIFPTPTKAIMRAPVPTIPISYIPPARRGPVDDTDRRLTGNPVATVVVAPTLTPPAPRPPTSVITDPLNVEGTPSSSSGNSSSSSSNYNKRWSATTTSWCLGSALFWGLVWNTR